jgi:hypothetical protein
VRYKSRSPRRWSDRPLLHLCHLRPEAKGKGRRRWSSNASSKRSRSRSRGADVSSRTIVWRSSLPSVELVLVVLAVVVVAIESKKVVRRDNVRLSNLMEHALCLLISQSEAENRGISECRCKRKGPAIVRVVQSNRKGNKTTSLIAPPITITLFPNSMLMKPALPCRNRWIVRGTPHDLLLRLQQEITRIRRPQKRPIAKMRKQMHKQLPCFGAQWELDVVVFDALH